VAHRLKQHLERRTTNGRQPFAAHHRRVPLAITRSVCALIALGTTCLVFAGYFGLATRAQAQTPRGCNTCEQGLIYADTGFAGSYSISTPQGQVGETYCVTEGRWYPNSAHAEGQPMTIANQNVWAALFTYNNHDDSDKAAISARVHRDIESDDTEWRAFPGLQARSDELWTQAQSFAGPYRTVIEWVQGPGIENNGGAIVRISVRSASGRAMANINVDTVSSNASLPTSMSTGETGLVYAPFNVASPGTWQIEAHGRDLPGTSLMRYEALDTREQSVVGPGVRTGATPATGSGNLIIPTKVSLAKKDAATGAFVAGAQISITKSGTADLVTKVTTTAAPLPVDLPPGDYEATETREPVGYLLDDPQPTKRFKVGPAGGSIALTWSDTPAVPEISTRISSPLFTPGGPVSDAVTVSGLPPHLPAFSLIVDYLGPVSPPTDGRCAALAADAFVNAPVVATTTLQIVTNGTMSTPIFTAPVTPGCTTFRVASTAPLWAGGPTLVSAPNSPNESGEIVHPVLQTQVSATSVVPGATVTDVLDVAGMPAWAGQRTLNIRLIGPVPAPPTLNCADLAPGSFDSAAVFASATMTIEGNGRYVTAAFTLPLDRDVCFNFEEEDTEALWVGGPTLRSPRGLASETVFVDTPPTPTPTQTPAPAMLALTGINSPVAWLTFGGAGLTALGLLLLAVARHRPRHGYESAVHE
jgi:hypothetical protein